MKIHCDPQKILEKGLELLGTNPNTSSDFKKRRFFTAYGCSADIVCFLWNNLEMPFETGEPAFLLWTLFKLNVSRKKGDSRLTIPENSAFRTWVSKFAGVLCGVPKDKKVSGLSPVCSWFENSFSLA